MVITLRFVQGKTHVKVFRSVRQTCEDFVNVHS